MCVASCSGHGARALKHRVAGHRDCGIVRGSALSGVTSPTLAAQAGDPAPDQLSPVCTVFLALWLQSVLTLRGMEAAMAVCSPIRTHLLVLATIAFVVPFAVAQSQAHYDP